MWNHDLENGLSYVSFYIKVFQMQNHFAAITIVSATILPVVIDIMSNF